MIVPITVFPASQTSPGIGTRRKAGTGTEFAAFCETSCLYRLCGVHEIELRTMRDALP